MNRAARVSIRLGVIAAVVAVLGIGAKSVESKMYANLLLQPPGMQIREQGKETGGQYLAEDDVGFVLPLNSDELVETPDFTYHRIGDAKGFPNSAPWPARADVAFLGDTLIMGSGVGEDKAFVTLIGRGWPTKTVINLGNPGAGAERQLRIFQRYGADLQPMLVVSCLYLASDLGNDVAFQAWLTDSRGKEYNDFRLAYTRRGRSRWEALEGKLEKHPLYGWAQSYVEPHLWGEHRIRHRRAFADGDEIYFDRDKVRFAQSRFTGKEAEFAFLAESLKRLEEFVAERDASLVVVLIPSKEELFAVDRKLSRYSAVGVVRRMLREMQVPFLDLYPILEEAGRQHAPYFKRDIHLNAYGNRVIADAFLEWVPESEP